MIFSQPWRFQHEHLHGKALKLKFMDITNTTQLFVLTDNSWLYYGLEDLLPDLVCEKICFDSKNISLEVEESTRVIILIDSAIFYKGDWELLENILIQCPTAIVCWLMDRNMGRVFPVCFEGQLILDSRMELESLRMALMKKTYKLHSQPTYDKVVALKITTVERGLINSFLSGLDISRLSKETGKAVKTLYAIRRNIMEKTGFRSMIFLQYIYIRNYNYMQTVIYPEMRGLIHRPYCP